MISDEEAAHILIALSRSKPRVVLKPIEEKEENALSVPVPRQKRSYSRIPRNMRRSFPTDPSSSSTAIVAYVSQEDPSPSPPRIPPLSRKKRHMDPSSSTAKVEYVSRKKRHMDPSSSTGKVEYVSRKNRPPLSPPIAKQPRKKEKVWTTVTTPDWLLKLVNGAEGEPKRIIEKELSATDVSRGHNRLSMPFSSIIDLEFLTPREKRFIDLDEEKKFKTGVNAKLVVKFVDSDDLEEFGVNLRKWRMPKKTGSATYVYNLVTGWNKVVEGCGLRESHKIKLWSYHSDGELCFALALATPAPRPPLLLLPPPPSDAEEADAEEMSSALVVYDESNDDLETK